MAVGDKKKGAMLAKALVSTPGAEALWFLSIWEKGREAGGSWTVISGDLTTRALVVRLESLIGPYPIPLIAVVQAPSAELEQQLRDTSEMLYNKQSQCEVSVGKQTTQG
eukprot:1149945-Pelagomonas_calceolata.AAC.11